MASFQAGDDEVTAADIQDYTIDFDTSGGAEEDEDSISSSAIAFDDEGGEDAQLEEGGSEDSEERDPFSDVEALLASDDEEESGEEDDLEGIDPEKEASTEGAQKRIRSLVQRAKQAEQAAQEQAEQYQAQMQQMYQQVQRQMQEREQEMQRRLEQREQQLAQVLQQVQSPQQRELGPLDKFKQDILQQTDGRLSEAVKSQVEPLKQQLEQERKAREEERAKMERRRRSEELFNRLQKARDEAVLMDFSEEDRKALGPEFDEMMMAYSGGLGVWPEEAAPRFRKFIEKAARGLIRAKSRQAKAKKTKTENLPATPRGTARGPSGKTRRAPPQEPDVKNMNMDDLFEYYASKAIPGA